MYSLTKKTMNIMTFLGSLLCIINLGCVTGNIGAPPKIEITYQLPSAWEVRDGIAYFKSQDSKTPEEFADAKIEIRSDKFGTDADAKKSAFENAKASGDSSMNLEFQERTIAGRKVYVYQGEGGLGKYSVLTFEKGGRVMDVMIYAHPVNGQMPLDYYSRDIEMLIQTLHFEIVLPN